MQFIILLLALVVGYMIFTIFNKNKEENNSTDIAENIPNFTLINIANITEFNNSCLENENVLLILFHTECEFCKEEINEILVNAERIHNIEILLISEEKIETLKKFSIDDLGLEKDSEVHFGAREEVMQKVLLT